MTEARPLFVILGGPNGAGKSTVASWLLPSSVVYVNADEIASGLPGYPSGATDIQAGRIMLRRMDALADSYADFGVETTLASRSLATRAASLKERGYFFRLLFLWTPNPEFSVARVGLRVRAGGHHVPEETVRRRYTAGLANFRSLYRPLADAWIVYDNTSQDGPRPIASGRQAEVLTIGDPELWDRFPDGEDADDRSSG